MHGLITAVRVLSNKGVDCGKQYHNEKNQSEYCVDDEEHDSYDSGDQAWLIEYIGKNQQADSVKEVDGTNRDVEGISALVHPWSDNTRRNQDNCLDKKQCDGLNSSRILTEGDEHALDDDIAKRW